MPSPVKPRTDHRTYQSPLRAQQAQQTRTAILDAAEPLFTTAGYAGTRLADVATGAGVSLATVKLVFGTKTELLLNLWHRTLAGGVDDRVPVAQRQWFPEEPEPAGPEAKLRRMAAMSTMVKQRIATLVGVIETAASTDGAIAELWARMQREFHDRTAGLIADLGELRPGLSPDDAIDIAWVLTSVRTYLMLVHERGWSPQRYETWVFEALRRELLG